MKKTRREKRPRTDEEISRAEDRRLKRFISQSAIKWATDEPEVRRQMVAQTLGYKIPNEVEKSERELINLINELAIKKLKENPKLAQTIAEARIRQVTEEMGLQIEGELWRRKPLTMDEIIVQFKKINEIKELVGGKSRWWDVFTDPKVAVPIINLINNAVTMIKSSSAPEAKISLRIDGKDRLVTREEFEQLITKGKIKQIGSVDPAEANNIEKDNPTVSEPETSNEADGENGETGATGAGD